LAIRCRWLRHSVGYVIVIAAAAALKRHWGWLFTLGCHAADAAIAGCWLGWAAGSAGCRRWLAATLPPVFASAAGLIILLLGHCLAFSGCLIRFAD